MKVDSSPVAGCANDDGYSLSFFEVCKLLNTGNMVVPLSTYKKTSQLDHHHKCRIMFLKEADQIGIRHLINNDNCPAILRGSLMAMEHALGTMYGLTFSRYTELKLERLLRRKKATILSLNQALEVAKLADELIFRSGKSKRTIHRRGKKTSFSACDFYQDFGGITKCWINGERHIINNELIPVIKSINRQVNKLNKLFGSKGNETWQRLIQQAI